MKLYSKVALIVFAFLMVSCKKENVDVTSSIKFDAEIYSILSYEKADADALLTIDDCDDTFYWCYSNEQKLIKFEVLGQGDDISIIFKKSGIDKPYSIVEHYKLENSYTIVPSKSNEYLQGGEILVSNHGKLLRKLTISYDGCD
jgi:hypothetical protein